MRLRDYYRLGKKVFKARVYQETGRFEMPYKYSFVLTNVCQSKCKTCHIWKIYEDNPEMLQRELDTDQFKEIIDSISDDAIWLNFSGGEPFLFPDIVEVIDYAFQNCPNLALVNIPTNAISHDHISDRLGEILENKPGHISLSVTISLDGLEGQHDMIRGVEGNWDRAMKLYEDLKEYEAEYDNFEAGFQTTVSKYNIDNLDEIFDFTRRSSIPIFTFAHESYYFYNEDGGEELSRNVDKSDLMNAIDYISSAYPVRRLQDIIPKLYLRLAEEFYRDQDHHVLPPSSGRGSVTIDPYGNVKLFSYFDTEMGDLKEHEFDIESVLRSEKAKKELEKVDNDEGEIYWVNCEAFPTIFQNPFRAVGLVAKSYLRE
ncbi:MAG: radical SAM protein [Candidatus Nanohaloarchaea archaeon]